jgi:hypothetical protein
MRDKMRDKNGRDKNPGKSRPGVTKTLRGFVTFGCPDRNAAESRISPGLFVAETSDIQGRDKMRDKSIYVTLRFMSRHITIGCGGRLVGYAA